MKRSKHQTSSSREAPNTKVQDRIKLILVSGLCTFGLGLCASFAEETTNSGPGRTDYRNFEIIPKRNIFNPRRSPAYVPRDPSPIIRPRTESLALVGVMSYGKGPMAFFDGSRSDYRRMLKANESIAGFKITAIDATSVKLSASTNEIELQLGMQLAREEQGEWKLSMRPESLETYARNTAMRSASQVNADRAAEAEQNANPNPFAGIGNFLANGGPFPGGGANGFPGFPNQTTPANTQPQPTVTAAPANASDILARLAARRAQETGEQPQPDQNPGPTTDQGPPTTRRGQSPQPPGNQQPVPQQVPDANGQPSLQPGQQQPDQSGQLQPGQPLLDQSGQPILDQSGQPILIQPGQQQPNP